MHCRSDVQVFLPAGIRVQLRCMEWPQSYALWNVYQAGMYNSFEAIVGKAFAALSVMESYLTHVKGPEYTSCYSSDTTSNHSLL